MVPFVLFQHVVYDPDREITAREVLPLMMSSELLLAWEPLCIRLVRTKLQLFYST